MTITDEAPLTIGDIGCFIAGSGHNRPEEMCAQAIELAERYGRRIDVQIRWALARLNAGTETDTDCEWLSDDADTAVEWLNDRVAPDGCYFTWDDGLMMYGDDDGSQDFRDLY